MTTLEKQNCLYVGIDVHKDTHTAVGISPFGEKLFEVTIGNYKSDFLVLENIMRHRVSHKVLIIHLAWQAGNLFCIGEVHFLKIDIRTGVRIQWRV